MAKQAHRIPQPKPVPFIPPGFVPSVASKSSVPAPKLNVESSAQVNLDAIGAACVAAATYAANVEGRKPTAIEAVSFASSAVEASIRRRLATGFNEPPAFYGSNGDNPVLIPPKGVDKNEAVFKATAAALKSDIGADKVLAGNAAFLTALAIAIDAFPNEAIAVRTVARIASALFAPKSSEIYRAGPDAWFGVTGGSNYAGTSRERGFVRIVDGFVK